MLTGLSYKRGGVVSNHFHCVFSSFEIIYIGKFDFAVIEKKCYTSKLDGKYHLLVWHGHFNVTIFKGDFSACIHWETEYTN